MFLFLFFKRTNVLFLFLYSAQKDGNLRRLGSLWILVALRSLHGGLWPGPNWPRGSGIRHRPDARLSPLRMSPCPPQPLGGDHHPRAWYQRHFVAEGARSSGRQVPSSLGRRCGEWGVRGPLGGSPFLLDGLCVAPSQGSFTGKSGKMGNEELQESAGVFMSWGEAMGGH